MVYRISRSSNGAGDRRLIGRVMPVMVAVSLLAAACSRSGPSAETASTSDVESTVTQPQETAPSTTTTTSVQPDSAAADNAGGQCPGQEPGSTSLTITVESATYPVRVFVPSDYQSETVPAVLNWHGLGSSGEQQAFLTDYESLAETEGFVVVHPTGLPGAIAGGAKGWELAQFDVAGRDDVAMAEALIDRLIEEFCVDSSRVYSTGMSNGGFFTARLVCELADKIAAAVSVAGVSHHDDCEPERPVPFMVFHGTADEIVPFAGGASTLASADSPPELQTFFDQVMLDEFAEFSVDFGCAPGAVAVELNTEVVRHDYAGCAEDVEMSFVEVVGGGHTWPGSPLGPLMEGFVGPTTDDISATSDGWAFMSRYSLEP